jgi:hypothetical protein
MGWKHKLDLREGVEKVYASLEQESWF